MGADPTVLQKAPDTMSTDAAKTLPEMSTASESTKTAATASPTKSEIAAVAYQLWLDNGCPVGTDQEDWFRAEAMLKKALVSNCEFCQTSIDVQRRYSIGVPKAGRTPMEGTLGGMANGMGRGALDLGLGHSRR
jgi:hypothetical protein